MANDSSSTMGNATATETSADDSLFDHGADHESVFGTVQLAQADGAQAPVPQAGQHIEVAPAQGAGPVVIRVAVAPGSIVDLPQPFEADAALMAKEGDGNLAIRVGDVTVILQGYVDANQEAPVTIEGADNQPIDIATILASTDPAIDIQTAAGPDAGQNGQGADNSGAILAQLEDGGGLGGLNAIGAQDQTELGYSVIDNSIRNDFADSPTLLADVFGFSVGSTVGIGGESLLRDPAQTNSIGSFGQFLQAYSDAIEHPDAPMYTGWADFHGTSINGNGHDFEEYREQTTKTTTVTVNFTGATGDLVLTGLANDVTSNGSNLRIEIADNGHTMFLRREEATATDAGDALVAVVHVEGPDANGQFTIETFLVNRLDHSGAGTGDAGKDAMDLDVTFTIYDGPKPETQEGEGGPNAPSYDGTFTASFDDDVPILEKVSYHNQHVTPTVAAREGEGTGGDDHGLIDEDWLKHDGAQDKDASWNSNAKQNGDTDGGNCLTGSIQVNFGADGAANMDGATEKLGKEKHAFVLDTAQYTLNQPFVYNGATLFSGGVELKVLSVGPDHLTVGIADEKGQSQRVEASDEPGDDTPTDPVPGYPIFVLTLDQNTGTFKFELKGPLDHKNPSDETPTASIFGDETGVSALVEEGGEDPAEQTIPLEFGVKAYDDDRDWVQAVIHIEINDDVPVARNDHDTTYTFFPETGNVITGVGTDGKVSGKDSVGGDGAEVTGVDFGSFLSDRSGKVGTEIPGNYGKLILHVDGSYEYMRTVGTPGGKEEVFTYTLTDGDGDTSTATLTILIGDAGVSVTCTEASVSEAGLPDGSDPMATSEVVSGTVTITAFDGIQSLQIGINAKLDMTDLENLGMAPKTYSDAYGELTLTGFDKTTNELSYTYTLKDNGSPNTAVFDITVTDTDGDSDTGKLKIAIVDDAPSAVCDTLSVNATKPATADVQFIIDVSGSMKDAYFNVPGNSYPDNGIGLSRYAVEQMLTKNPEVQNVQFVLFNEGASHTVWMTAQQALDYVKINSNFNGSGATNFDKGLAEAMEAFTASDRPLPKSDQTLVYFFSDGNPNQPNSDPGITSNGAGASQVSVTEWQNFVNANGISNAFAVGIGSLNSGEITQLNPIAYPNGSGGAEPNRLNITSSNVSTLTDGLDNLIVPNTPASAGGNVLGNDVSGADGFGKLVSVTYDGIPHTFDAATHQFTIDLGATRGKLVINDDGSFTYTAPAGAADGTPFHVDYTMQDGDGSTSAAQLKIDINTAPTTDLNGGTTGADLKISFIEQTPIQIAPQAVVSDDANVTSMTVTLTNRPDGNSESLSIDPANLPAGLSVTAYDPATGKLVISGSGSAADYQAALRAIVYNDTSEAPNATDRKVTVVVNDGAFDSVSHTVTIGVTPVNDAPTAVILPLTFNATEQTDLTLSGKIAGQFTMQIGDVDAGGDKVTVTLSVGEGKLTISEGNSGADVWSGNGTSTVVIKGSVAEINNLLGGIDTGQGSAGSIKYYNGSDSPPASVQLTMTVNDNGENGTGGAKSASDTAIIAIADVNDKPDTDLNGSGHDQDCDVDFYEQTAVQISGSGTVSDDLGIVKSMTVTLTNRPDGIDVESLGVNLPTPLPGGLLATYTAATGVLAITGTASVADYQTVLRAIVYNNSSDTPNTADRKVTVVVNDGDLNSTSHSITIDVHPVNDAPTVSAPGSFEAKEQTDLIISGKGITLKDVDAGGDTLTVKLSVGEGKITVTSGNSGVSVWSGNGTDEVTLTGSQSALRKLLEGTGTGKVVYNANTDAPGASTQLTVQVDDNGNNGSGPDQVVSAVSIINIQAVNDAPTGCDDTIITNSWSAGGVNKSVDIPEWVLTFNDSDPEGSKLDIAAGSVSGASSGTVQHVPGTDDQGIITFSDTGQTKGGSFEYKATDGTLADSHATHVDVVQDTNGSLDGGNGDDIIIAAGTTAVTVNGGSGNDIIIGSGGHDTLNGGYDNDIILGGSGNDTINGDQGDDRLEGGEGKDRLDGGSGTDLIFGQGGDDTMIFSSNGNSGNDKFDGGDGFDRIQVTGTGMELFYNAAKFANVEMIDIGDGNSNGNEFSLKASDLGVHDYGTIGTKQISLFVVGDDQGGSRDDVNLQGFTNSGVTGSFNDGTTQHSFTVYTGMNAANQTVHIAVETGLDVHTS